jgi:hypothetical protein
MFAFKNDFFRMSQLMHNNNKTRIKIEVEYPVNTHKTSFPYHVQYRHNCMHV